MANLILSIEIPGSKVSRSKARFLAARPNIESVGDTDELLYTDKEWFEESVKRFLRKIDNKGKLLLAVAAADNDDMFQI